MTVRYGKPPRRECRVGDTKLIKGVMHVRKERKDPRSRATVVSNGKVCYEWVPVNETERTFVLHPGNLTSIHDRSIHGIGSKQLVHLYRLERWPYARIIVVAPNETRAPAGTVIPESAIHLYPDPTGRYRVPGLD
jgi:hypothetical protein